MEIEHRGFLGAAKEATCKILHQIKEGRSTDEVISGKFASYNKTDTIQGTINFERGGCE